MRTLLATILSCLALGASSANRLTYLDGDDPYYVGRDFARLTTPQWVGEEGVEAVVILSIDDMRDAGKYETFLRPILDRLKQIDGNGGRASLSIMTCSVDPKTPTLQTWLKEGVSLETHTFDHPCPLLAGGDFAKAKSTYDRCVDLLAEVPNSVPVAFRMPCCDSKNTPSPRFYAEIFNKLTPGHRFVSIDSSVFNITTSKDRALPIELTTDADGRERFRKYVPFPSFVNTIEDYPYPYVIGKLCWEFPCATPSDWQAQNIQRANNPRTVEDWRAQLDVTVIKQGVMPVVFHPHGWVKAEQIVELIDYASQKYGKKVKFLSFADAQQRLDKNLLAGHPLRSSSGTDNGVRILDVNADGFMDVVIGNKKAGATRVWVPAKRSWSETAFPCEVADVRFGVVRDDGAASAILRTNDAESGWHFTGDRWTLNPKLVSAIPENATAGRLRFRDLDHDGKCELVGGADVYEWESSGGWKKLPFTLPPDTAIADASGADAGLRFVDIDEDGDEDVIFSNEKRYSLHLFTDMTKGWSYPIRVGTRGEKGATSESDIPPIVTAGTSNGAWFHSRTLWFQNENTASLPDHVARCSSEKLLEGAMPGPTPPDRAVDTFKVYPGFKIELVAAEPLVADPVAFNWSADGKLWVAEMGDYPLGEDGKGSAGGRVRFLEDLDGDGKYDKSTVFLDKLSYPNGVTPYRKGVLITAAPDIIYAEDTDGDGKADVREVLFTGFKKANPQHRVQGFAYGLDNWFHAAGGDSPDPVTSIKTGKVHNISGRDLRIRPDTGELDPQSGSSQHPRSRDEWGNWFSTDNSNPCQQYVLDDRYVRRNPHIAPPALRRQVPEMAGAAQIFPISKPLARFNDLHTLNHFTSACGLTFYRDELFGSGYRGNSFVSEPVHNLIHREIVWQDGLLVKSRHTDDEHRMEFIASTDNWFRPTMLRVGPDGALYIADMYRLVIEHPQWIPKEWQEKLDLRSGHDKGRIYRVYPVAKQLRTIPNLAKLDTAGLVAALDAPGSWQRDMAQQLLVERQDKSAVPALEKLAATSMRALARLHALCTLDGLDALRPDVLIKAMDDVQPGVRAHAVRLCETRLKGSTELADAMLKLVKDPDPTVRLQLACTLGEWNDPRVGDALATIALRDGKDQYITAAVMSSVNDSNLAALLAGVTSDVKRPPSGGLLSSLVRVAAATNNKPALAAAVNAIVKASSAETNEPAQRFTSLANALDGLEQGGFSLAELSKRGGGVKDAVAKLATAIDAAREAAIDEKANADVRAAAVRLLGRGGAAADDLAVDVDLLGGLLTPQTPDKVQSVAITRLARVTTTDTTKPLLAAWSGMTPALRTQSLDAFLQRQERVPKLLDAIEGKKILAADLDASRRRQLLEHGDEAIRARAAKVFAGAINPDRQKVIDQYTTALSLEGDLARGREFFSAVCATCHKVGDVGTNVGPNLMSAANHDPEYYLLHILDPNRAVDGRYVNYVMETNRGEMFSGVLSGETGNSVTLMAPGGKPQTVLRTELKRLKATSVSAMPEGLETGRTPQDFADLLAYLASSGPLPQRKTFEGNTPQLVKASGDGNVIRLLPSNAEIYGSTVILEPAYGNLGYWSSVDDRVMWSVDAPKGVYDVVLEWACDDSAAGNAFVLRAARGKLAGKVAGTGGWDKYRKEKVGRIQLSGGSERLSFRSEGKINNALIDLKAIELVPVAQQAGKK